MDEKTQEQLGEQLHRILSGRRYLIILDDMWSIEVWDRIKFFFPDNYNRSRIIVTTRLSDMANLFGTSKLALSFLDDKDSWILFCDKAFAQGGCPPELEQVGKKIVKKCRGLPLSIVVIGGLLGKSSRTWGYWENVAKDISSVLSSAEDDQLLSVLSLSYNHLPTHLKPCFLYLGVFPEDHVIRVSQLIKLWIAEGFIKPQKDQSLEEVAEGIIKDLVDRNLILVRRLGLDGKLKSCKIHDLIRNLCIRIAEKEKFFYVTKACDASRELIDRQRHIVVQGNTSKTEYLHRAFHTLTSAPLASSTIRERGLLSFRSRLLRALVEAYGESLDTTFQQINLRFVAYESYETFLVDWNTTYNLPSSISLLWNLQTLIIMARKRVVAPSEIWEMPNLRLLKCNSICLPDPPPSGEQEDSVMRSLHTLKTVLNFRCNEEVCKRMPNIKRLHIYYDDDFSDEGETGFDNSLCNVGRLNKLESLNCDFTKAPNRDDLRQNLTFPSSLRKLTLHNCKLHWDDLTAVGSLPSLEVLNLRMDSFVGPEWSPVEGEFLRLKFLRVEWARDLIHWNADSSHFPVLEELVLECVHKLEEIPSGTGDIPTLESICVYDCSVSAAISAVKILEEQESLGNQGLRVTVAYAYDVSLEEFKEKLEQEGLTSQNFHLIDG